MHEMTIAMRIVEISSSAIPARLKGIQVEAVNVQIGKLTAVVPESLRYCFDIVSRDSPLAGAELRIEEIPVQVLCLECGETSTIEAPPFACCGCGGVSLDALSGRELSVTSIEVADPADCRLSRE
jgi:hydrogenase nickel incorporation protein HypA/HybF